MSGVNAAQVLQAYERAGLAASSFAKKGFSAASVYAEMCKGGKIDGERAEAVCKKYGIDKSKINKLIESNAGSSEYLSVLQEQNPAVHTDEISQMLSQSGKLPRQQGKQVANSASHREQYQQRGGAKQLWAVA